MNRIARDFVAPVLTIIVSAGLLLGTIGWLIAREPAGVEITPTLRFVAFAMAAMGLAWLIGPFLLVRYSPSPCNQGEGRGEGLTSVSKRCRQAPPDFVEITLTLPLSIIGRGKFTRSQRSPGLPTNAAASASALVFS